MNVVVLSAQTWDGRRVPASFAVTIDGATADVDPDPFPTFAVPDGASAIEVAVTPGRSDFWETVVSLSVDGDGAISGDDAATSVATVDLLGARLSTATVVVSRVRDVSAAVAALLTKANRPTTRAGQPAGDADMFAAIADYPPSEWATPARDAISFVDREAPILGGLVNAPPAVPVAAGTDGVVLELAGVKAPRLLAVNWPAALAPAEGADPTPFLVYLRPGVGQEVVHGYYQNPELPPYPFNHDYAYYALYQYLWYAMDPFTGDASPKGLAMQVAAAGKDVVTVLPCNAVGPEFGAFMDAASVHDVLAEIQAFMFRRAGVATPPAEIGRTAMAAFSSGNGYLATFLGTPKNRAHRFCTEILQEVYLFDPPKYLVDSTVASALAWAGPSATGRHVRIYNQFLHDAHTRVLGAPPPAVPFVATAGDGTRTVGVLTVATWKRSIEARTGQPLGAGFDWRNVHQLIPSMLLTHAVAISGF